MDAAAGRERYDVSNSALRIGAPLHPAAREDFVQQEARGVIFLVPPESGERDPLMALVDR